MKRIYLIASLLIAVIAVFFGLYQIIFDESDTSDVQNANASKSNKKPIVPKDVVDKAEEVKPES